MKGLRLKICPEETVEFYAQCPRTLLTLHALFTQCNFNSTLEKSKLVRSNLKARYIEMASVFSAGNEFFTIPWYLILRGSGTSH